MKKFVALSSIAVMMLVGNNTVFANECLLNEANEKEFIQEYKGVEQDIRLNSALLRSEEQIGRASCRERV